MVFNHSMKVQEIIFSDHKSVKWVACTMCGVSGFGTFFFFFYFRLNKCLCAIGVDISDFVLG